MIAASRPGYVRERVYVSTTDTYDEALDLDYVAIEHALNGEPVTLTTAEKIHAARLLTEMGVSIKQIMTRISVGQDTVTGWRDNGWKPVPYGTNRKGYTPAKHGERRMYYQHLRAGEKACEECLSAKRATERRLRQARKQRSAT